METKRPLFLTLSGVVIILALGIILFAVLQRNLSFLPGIGPTPASKPFATQPFGKLEKFKTDEEFKEYMENRDSAPYYGGMLNTMEDRVMKSAPSSIDAVPQTGGGNIPERVSQTNVQVLGIDEPDIVKTDGDNIYYSSPYFYRVKPMPLPMEKRVVPLNEDVQSIEPSFFNPPEEPPQKPEGGLFVVKSFPPASLKKLTTMPLTGDLLLAQNMLVVFDEANWEKRTVAGYDLKNPSNPEKKWSIPYEKNSYRVQARLYKNKLYLVTRQDAGGGYPCPLKPFDISGREAFIPCTQIYHPVTPVTNDTIYTVSRINPVDGTVEKNISFVGSMSDSTVYMSRDNLYITYNYSGDIVKIMYGFMSQNTDIFPVETVQKMAKLQDYDISQQAKMLELTTILSKFTMGMDESKRLAFENNLRNRMEKFMESNARQLEKTGIVKIGIDGFNVIATGDVPGRTLNQFSLDEYNNHLRIATTTGQNSWVGNFGQLTESFSDVYILDSGLKTTGSVLNLGKTERIYSVRFMADRGYVVTFRQTDPFYVLDLSDTRSPQLKGELKIPGYSSYLHPLTEDMLVGVGQERGNVKLSLFDVSSPENPVELDKYAMSEYWSEAMNNHHAFLADEKHEVFFMPGSQGGYVMSYKGKKLEMAKAVADYQVQRAVYINDFLYIVGQNKITVLNESDWSKAGELDL